MRKKAIESEKRDITRTSLVIDEYNTNEIIGYFSLMIKSFNFASDVSVSSKKRLTGNKSADNFVTILIAQLGRSDNYKGLFSGQEVLMQALNNCLYIKELCGLKIVCVEYDDISNLNDFYIGNEFRILQVNPSRKILAYLKL
ncbi:hypothetical protein [Sutcliffiella horikoshii]|uniref:hypothetical protein n=1 Tax=Sutcliffiella horikoshii TaxID=79883 RepID=UPI00384E32B1